VTQSDAEFLYGFVLEVGKPERLVDLTLAAMRHRVEQEQAALRKQIDNGTLYQPKRTFQAGESVTFPALKFATGVVDEIRPANNPDLGPFDVITVTMSDGTHREFASNYTRAHRLNDQDPTQMLDNGPVKPVEELFVQYGDHVGGKLAVALEHNPEFIRIGDEWFLRAMMAEVNIGHLNLAEAVLDVASGGPLTAEEILRDLGLPPDVTVNVQEASLNAKLATDLRFDEISLNDQPAWFLRRLEPAEVRQRPAPLEPVTFPGATTLSDETQKLVVELDDELDYDGSPVERANQAQTVLIFAHRRAGTLGWSRRLAGVLPQSNKPRVPIRLRDRVTTKEFTVWLVRDGRYIWGLGDWYRANDVPAGAHIELTHGEDDNVVLIDFRRRKPKREWVRVASVRDARLHLETAQRAVSCEADDLMSVFADDVRQFDVLRGERSRDAAQAVREAFPEIAKLSPQGNVHARTLYAAVNVITRAAPREVFAALTASGVYVPVGDNYWHLGER